MTRPITNSRLLAAGLALALAACATPPAPTNTTDGAWPPLPRVARAFAGSTGAEIALDAMLDQLAGADVVFCGETHLDDVTHRVELAVYEGLLARRGGRVVLAMEMFATDVQAALDDYVAGRSDEPTFLARSNPWGNYATGYRALVERARRDGRPVVGANAPPALVRKVSQGGAEAFAALSAAEKALLPPALLPSSAAYWERVTRATRGHGGSGAPDSAARLYSGQSLWDNTMGWSCVRALEQHPGHLVLHVNGSFHTAHHDGTAAQFLQRRPDARVLTLAIETTDDLAGGRAPVTPAADFTVLVERRARGLDSGLHAVTAHREQRYRLRVPAASAPLPLLLWLPAEGLRSDDAAALWELALGGAAAVAVLEPPYAQIEADLSRGGRWFFAETHTADLDTLLADVARLRGYIERHHAIDPARVVIAGEGTGATVAAAAALWGSVAGARVLAFAPREFKKLGERAVPDRAAEVRALRVLPAERDREWWQGELAQHASRGLGDALAAPAPPVQAVQAVQEALGVAAAPAAGGSEVALLVRPATSPRAALWQQLAVAAEVHAGRRPALRALADDTDLGDLGPAKARALAFEGEWPAQLEAALQARGVAWLTPPDAERAGLPPAPGSFGGTTILVVPAGCPPATRAAWRALAQRNPMARHGRFYRLLLAFADETPTLADALQEMVAAHRSNALVVPAAFYAAPDAMAALRTQAAPFADQVDLTWLPGLGGSVGRRAPDS